MIRASAVMVARLVSEASGVKSVEVQILSRPPLPLLHIRVSYGMIKSLWKQLKLQAEDGKMRETDCAKTEGLLRIVQSIPSPKTEPFKHWLAKVGGSIRRKMI